MAQTQSKTYFVAEDQTAQTYVFSLLAQQKLNQDGHTCVD